MTVPQSGAGESNAGGKLHNDVGVVMQSEVAVAVGALAGAGRSMAGRAAESPMIVAMLPFHIRESRYRQSVRPAAVGGSAMARTATVAGRSLDVATLAVRRHGSGRRIGEIDRLGVGMAAGTGGEAAGKRRCPGRRHVNRAGIRE